MNSDPVHDFDFFFGAWTVKHRRLKARLENCDEWTAFEGVCETRSIWGGAGNMDDNWLDAPDGGYRAVTLRAFDPKTRTWAIWWLDLRDPHTLEVPVVGGFEDGVGRFFAEDTLRGQPIKVRFVWSDITATSCRWEQAFSPDGGQGWEVNWTMAFTRTG